MGTFLSAKAPDSAEALHSTYSTFDVDRNKPSTSTSPTHPSTSSRLLPILSLLSSCFFYTLMGVITRYAIQTYRTPVLYVSFYCGVTGTIMTQLILVLLNQPVLSTTKPWSITLVLLRSLLGAASIMCEYAALQTLPVAIVTILYSTNSIMTSCLAWLFLDEPLTITNYIVLALVVAGAAMVGLADPTELDSGHWHHAWGIVFALLMALFFAIVFVLMRYLRSEAHPIGTELTSSVCCALLSVAWRAVQSEKGTIGFFVQQSQQLTLGAHVALMGISVCNCLGTVLFNWGSSGMRAGKTSVIMASDIPMSLVFGLLFLGELPRGWLEVGGCTLISLGAYVTAVEEDGEEGGANQKDINELDEADLVTDC